ncbi:N-acetylmuramoyl-L-alanine amidase [Clostridium chrysemydis]|uniref:N-acetylmuramoyl-L-alanine amidase n=1 Tax=Clostridium chrysemydis TaxID=2665504 RepID=UPI001883FE9D|nr:N-acetylmuramoyl-L-alanine amidase [Clostridium chrysemydis]
MVLKKGSKGENVLFLQYGLHIIGFSPKGLDSIFGENTKISVEKFQKAFKLTIDGIAGDKTLNKLKIEIKSIQEMLLKKGINIGKVDGIAGVKTFKGVKLFQKIKGLKEDGVVKDKTKELLYLKDNYSNSFKIVIDPGHGGKDPGATSNGLKEKDINLKISKALKEELLRDGFTVKLTREDDRFLSLKERSDIGNSFKGDLFISIHCNSSLNTDASETEVFIYNLKNRETKDLGERIALEISKSLNLKNRGVKEGNFAVLRCTKMKAILIETAFLSNREDSKKLKENFRLFSIAIKSKIN